jgi:VWFA-related protein
VGFRPKFQISWILFRSLCFWVGIFFASALGLTIAQVPKEVRDLPVRSFNMRVNVELVTLEVAALDKDGNPVRNLKKENFYLYEDGREQEIQSFDEVDTDTPSGIEQSRGKTVLIFIDESTIAPIRLKSVCESAKTFVKKHMNPTDLFAVASFGDSLKIRQNFTHEPERILGAIAQSESSSAAPTLPDGNRAQNSHAGDPIFSLILTNKMANLLWALNSFSVSVERLKGQKTVLIYSESGFSNREQIQTVYAQALDSAKKSNVVFYTIDPGGLVSGSTREAEPVYELTSPARPALRTAANTQPDFENPNPNPASQHSILQSLARETGALAILNANNLDAELDKLNFRMSHYYILGFESNNPKHDGALRKLKVKTDLKGASLIHRKEYLDRRSVDRLAASGQDKSLLDAVASPEAVAQIPIIFRAAYFYDAPDAARVLVLATIQTAKIAARKKSGQSGGALKLMGAAYAEDGSVSARFSDTLQITPDPHRMSAGYRNYFLLRPGRYRLKLAVSDEGNNLGSAEQFLDIPAFPKDHMTGSSLVLAEEVSRQPDLTRNIEAALFDEYDPLIYSGLQIVPSVENKFLLDLPLPVFFNLYNIHKDSKWKFVATARLLRETGENLVTPVIPLDENISKKGNSEATIGITLPFKGIAPGKYKLVVETSDPDSHQAVTVQTEFEFVKSR